MTSYQAVSGLCVAGTLMVLLVSCGDSYRVEPLLLEKRAIAAGVVQQYKDAPRLQEAERLVGEFVRHLKEDRCSAAWQMLSSRYRKRFADLAGELAEGERMFCNGYSLSDEMFVQGDWQTILLGDKAFYMTTPPTEMALKNRPGEELFYVVQRDGGYRAFLLVSEGERAGIEPF